MGAFANTLSNFLFFFPVPWRGHLGGSAGTPRPWKRRLQLLPLASCSMLCPSKEQQTVTPELKRKN